MRKKNAVKEDKKNQGKIIAADFNVQMSKQFKSFGPGDTPALTRAN